MSIEKKQASIEFLIAEFNALQGHVVKMEEAKSNRINFFLLIVAAVAAGISGLASSPNLLLSLNIIIAVAGFVLLALGLTVLIQLVHYSQAIVSLYRRAGRIRRWFADFDIEIAPYLAFEAGDDHPKVDLVGSAGLAFRGGDAIVLILNAASFSALVVAFVNYLYPFSPLFTVAIAAISALFAWFFQQNRLHAALRKIEEEMKKNIRFPCKDA